MLFYPSLFIVFLYLKIARVFKKEERLTKSMYLQNILVLLSAISIFLYGFSHMAWYIVLSVSFLFFIIVALLVTIVQLGIFVDGKPQFGISKLYKFLPLLTLLIIFLSVMLWIKNFFILV